MNIHNNPDGKVVSAKDFIKDSMRDKYGRGDSYTSQRDNPRPFPTLDFYWRIFAGPLRWLCGMAAKGRCDDNAWVFGSAWVGDILEKTGGMIDIGGMTHMDRLDGPCVFIANHMSTLETFLLPAIIRPRRPLTFVVKKSLVGLPWFGPVMRSRDPVVVGRVNPREDLEAVLGGGVERLRKGISIVVFPQSTRSLHFDPARFNTIGVKLARKAGVPVVPLALKTDAWGQGARIKELGRIRPDLPARFLFGAPLEVRGTGKAEHVQISEFIGENLGKWQAEDGINA